MPTDPKGLSPAALFAPLEHDTVRLVPATPDDAPEMARVLSASDEARHTFDLFTSPPIPADDERACRDYLTMLTEHPATTPFTLRLRDTDELIGGTSYCDIRPRHRGLEVGWTWIAPPHRRTRVNAEMKFLLLARAFDTDLFPAGPAIRVQLKTHHRNTASRAAIAALGAVYEGTLRNHVVMPDGHLRHTVMFSITDDEWPAVKQGLLDRLA